ncbi:MAG TPA: cation:dicarboxylase symporter family transporter, partial [Campylobacterales bacterium]|nr:cation:dicarboxylase symporter family transporter [Campylobacterales bacterium]
VDLSFIDEVLIFVTTIFASVGAAGIPGAGLIMMMVVLDSVGLPHTYIPLILVVDRILDMFRTATNVWGDLVATKILDTKTKFEK